MMNSPQMHSDQQFHRRHINQHTLLILKRRKWMMKNSGSAVCKETGRASASAIQSEFGIGYPRIENDEYVARSWVIELYHNGPCSVLI
jgi:hypothetical protein